MEYDELEYYTRLEEQQFFSLSRNFEVKKYAICSSVLNNMQVISTEKLIDINYAESINKEDISKVILWGSLFNSLTSKALKFAVDNTLPIEIWENGFIRSVKGWGFPEDIFTSGYSFIKDISPYFDSVGKINSKILIDIKNYKCNTSEVSLARKCIDFIVKNEITKYNHQPNVRLSNTKLKKLLLIDQSYKDMSIQKGQANEESFINMVKDALKEDAKVYLKYHPDTLAKTRGGYFNLDEIQNLISLNKDKIEVLNYEANPVNTIKQVDEVYCVTSQFGFESLMCGKKVHCYGKPVYSCILENRISLEEFFFIMYIKNTYWIDPFKKEQTDIFSFLTNFLILLNEWRDNK